VSLDAEKLRERARKAHARFRRARRDPRYLRAVGRFVNDGLLETNDPLVVAHDAPVALDDILWAGRYEPRLLELLPAVVVKRPSILAPPVELPADLREAVCAVKAGRDHPDFRGVPGEAYARWVPHVGRKGHPSQLRSFRLRRDDLDRLRRLKLALDAPSETEVLRMGLRVLETALTARTIVGGEVGTKFPRRSTG
jgi:hypothetical protein